MLEQTNEREKLLKKLIRLEKSLSELESQLSRFSWDIAKDMVYLKRRDIEFILKKFIENLLPLEEVVKWANLIEGRDGIGGMDDVLVKDIIYELANPDLHGLLTKDRAKALIKALK
ncbi:MAG: hypothetical protein K0M45_03105 [Candidatus Paracaedibacteraceae bacterium]|nr:hypothetical protein [Candidatus Paracaedibacteraceae bacterium]